MVEYQGVESAFEENSRLYGYWEHERSGKLTFGRCRLVILYEFIMQSYVISIQTGKACIFLLQKRNYSFG